MKKLLLTSLLMTGVMIAGMAQESRKADPAKKKPAEETMSQKRTRIVREKKATVQKSKSTQLNRDALKQETVN